MGQMGVVVRQMFDAPISVSKSPSWMDFPVPEWPCQLLSIWEGFFDGEADCKSQRR